MSSADLSADPQSGFKRQRARIWCAENEMRGKRGGEEILFAATSKGLEEMVGEFRGRELGPFHRPVRAVISNVLAVFADVGHGALH
jgi:hypothetical protein